MWELVEIYLFLLFLLSLGRFLGSRVKFHSLTNFSKTWKRLFTWGGVKQLLQSFSFPFVVFSKAEELNLNLLYPNHNLNIEGRRRRRNSDTSDLPKCASLCNEVKS